MLRIIFRIRIARYSVVMSRIVRYLSYVLMSGGYQIAFSGYVRSLFYSRVRYSLLGFFQETSIGYESYGEVASVAKGTFSVFYYRFLRRIGVLGGVDLTILRGL